MRVAEPPEPSGVAAPAHGPSPAAPAYPPRRRLQRLDLLRIALFLFVLFAHAVGTINIDEHQLRGMGLYSMLNHFARYGFVYVTGFVLFLGYHDRAVPARQFWRRRFGLVVMPYLVWSVTYIAADAWMLSDDPFPAPAEFLRAAAVAIVRGDAKYQLYFLLISMQIYLVFPALSALVRRTRGHHGKLLAAAAAIQFTGSCLLTYLPAPTGRIAAEIHGFWWKSLPLYALFLVGGALCAVHFDRFDAWLRRNTLAVGVSGLAVAILTICIYYGYTYTGDLPKVSRAATNPLYLPWHIAATALLLVAATALTDRRTNPGPRSARWIQALSLRAFGLFVVHPLVIDLIHKSGFVHQLYEMFPDSTVPRSIGLALATLVVSLALVEVLLRLPGARYIVARDRIPLPRRRRGPARQIPEQVASAERADAAAPESAHPGDD